MSDILNVLKLRPRLYLDGNIVPSVTALAYEGNELRIEYAFDGSTFETFNRACDDNSNASLRIVAGVPGAPYVATGTVRCKENYLNPMPQLISSSGNGMIGNTLTACAVLEVLGEWHISHG